MPKSTFRGGKLRSSFTTFQLSAVIPRFSTCHSNGSRQVVTCIATSAPLCHTWFSQWTAGHTAPCEARGLRQQTNRLRLTSSSMFGVLQEARRLHKKIYSRLHQGLTVAQARPKLPSLLLNSARLVASMWLCSSQRVLAGPSKTSRALQRPLPQVSSWSQNISFLLGFLSVTDDQSAGQSQCRRGC